jgi:hypothetical protein
MKLGKHCIETINPDVADIVDIYDIYTDGATTRPDYLAGGQTIGDVVQPGWSIRDTALVIMCQRGLAGVDAALAVTNAHARAVALDACEGGWECVLGKPIAVDSEGKLFAVEWLETQILQLICPSTDEVYHLHVPAKMKTPTAARDWVNRGVKTEIRS